ncbi:MAG: hypothetical protein OEV66_01845 [Spirochaetia bacterium]|nr:hypothetical protein [Spirochaetia bacterium]
MFTQIFREIWKNKISRYVLLIALTLILVGAILNGKMVIYNFFYRLYSGEVFFDPYTYKKNVYGFSENPGKAEKLFLKGLKKIVNISADLYKTGEPDLLLSGKFNHDLGWENFTSDNSIEMVYMLLHDLELFCVPFDTGNSPESDHSENLKKRYSIKRNSSKELAQYALKEDEFTDIADKILMIDQEYFYFALQKKPDSVPVLLMREKLLKALCRPRNISVELTRALEYREYKTEKEVYSKFKGNNAEFIANETFKILKQDKQYAKILKLQFNSSYYMTRNMDEKIRQSYNNYLLHNDTFYLENYLKNVLEMSHYSGLKENQKAYDMLVSMKNDRMMTNKTFVYTLAELSFRAHRYQDTQKYLDIVSKTSDLAGTDLYRVRRLYFMLDLLNTG